MYFKTAYPVLIASFLVLEAATLRTPTISQRRSISGSRGEIAGSQQGFVESGPSASAIAGFGGSLPIARYGPPVQGNGGYNDAGAPPHGSIGIAEFATDSNAVGFGGSQSFGQENGAYGNEPEPGMAYQFQYNVNEYGNNFGHSQSSDGNRVTGRYFVQLPDGRMQTVLFKADALSGYTADVQYEGLAQYPSASNPGGAQQGYGGAGSSSAGYGSVTSLGGHGVAVSSAGGYASQGGLGLGNGVGGGSIGQLPLALHADDNYNRQIVRF